MNQPEECVQALETACHRFLSDPGDAGSRALLLEALATYNAVPLASFPTAVRDLVTTSRDQADALCVRILETSSGASIVSETENVCHTLGSLGEALRVSHH